MKTERLELTPMTAEEVFALAESCGDAELAEAYREMGDGVLKYPDQALWYTAWRIVLNKTGETVEDLCFKGLPDSGRPEIGYGILPEWEGKGYATEAVRAACSWTLFSNRGRYRWKQKWSLRTPLPGWKRRRKNDGTDPFGAESGNS